MATTVTLAVEAPCTMESRGPCRGNPRISTVARAKTHGRPRKCRGHCRGLPPKSQIVCIRAGGPAQTSCSLTDHWAGVMLDHLTQTHVTCSNTSARRPQSLSRKPVTTVDRTRWHRPAPVAAWPPLPSYYRSGRPNALLIIDVVDKVEFAVFLSLNIYQVPVQRSLEKVTVTLPHVFSDVFANGDTPQQRPGPLKRC